MSKASTVMPCRFPRQAIPQKEGDSMDIPLNITFHNTRKTANIEEFIADQAENLQKFHKRIQNCEVVIDQPHHHHQKGNEYYVKIVVTVPKQTIAVTSSTSRRGGVLQHA